MMVMHQVLVMQIDLGFLFSDARKKKKIFLVMQTKIVI